MCSGFSSAGPECRPQRTQSVSAASWRVSPRQSRPSRPASRTRAAAAPPPGPKSPLCARSAQGFDVHAGVAIPAHARDALERLLRYLARAPLPLSRLNLRGNGNVVVDLKRTSGAEEPSQSNTRRWPSSRGSPRWCRHPDSSRSGTSASSRPMPPTGPWYSQDHPPKPRSDPSGRRDRTASRRLS